MQRLNSLDTAFVSFETEGAPLHVAAVMVMEPKVGGELSPRAAFEEVRDLVAARLHLVPIMRQRILQAPLGISPPVRVDDPDFDLNLHLTRGALPAPGGQAELDRYVGRIMSRPMFLDRPLWEMIFLEGLEGGRYALFARFHHAMIDGISGAHILANFFDLSEEPRDTGTPPPFEPEPLPSGMTLLGDAGASWLHHPMALVESASRTLTSLFKAIDHNRELPEGRAHPTSVLAAPKSSINGTISAQRSYAATDLRFEEVRQVGKVLGGTVTDVVMATVAGALNRLFAARGETIDRDLVAMVPMSIRPEEQMDAMGNQISTMLVSLCTTIEDPVERLRAIHESADAGKEQDRILGSQVTSDLTRLVPPVVANLMARAAHNARIFDHVPPVGNVLVSSVPGPTFPVWCAGRKVAAVYPVGPIAATIGLNITALRYLDTLHLGLLGCQHLVPEVKGAARCMVDAFDELSRAANLT